MSDDTFSVEYYQHLLSSLTLNSRALIVELTNLAEKYVDNAQEIVDLIEERIQKILPKYKLYTFYLMDSIIKNIGNPYNLMFARNLYRNFTGSYSIIDDTPTRQNMINLFKTWVSVKTTAGSDIFPYATLQKVEKFIIQATSLNNSVQQENNRVTRDVILRESNYLLQYIIVLDEALDKFLDSSSRLQKDVEALRSCKLSRNDLIFETNNISENAMLESRDFFESKKNAYFERLREIRKALDLQSSKQQEIFKEADSLARSEHEGPKPHALVQINLSPHKLDISAILEEALDFSFLTAVNDWGNPSLTDGAPVSQKIRENQPSFKTEVSLNPRESLASSFGINLESLEVQISAHEDHVNERIVDSPGASVEVGGDGYDPGESPDESEFKQSRPLIPYNGSLQPTKSNLKRSGFGTERSVKRVRFDV